MIVHLKLIDIYFLQVSDREIIVARNEVLFKGFDLNGRETGVQVNSLNLQLRALEWLKYTSGYSHLYKYERNAMAVPSTP